LKVSRGNGRNETSEVPCSGSEGYRADIISGIEAPFFKGSSSLINRTPEKLPSLGGIIKRRERKHL
jgi:hypothetical protein